MVWVYGVVSSAAQAATVEDQLLWARSVANERGWEITREFSGVASGAGGTRKLLQQLLEELRATPKSSRPSRVLLIRLDRLGRGDGLDVIAAISEIRRLSVTLFTRDDGEVRIERAADALLPAVRSIIGGLENEVRRDKSTAMHKKRRELGLVWRAPYGLRVSPERRLVVFEHEAAVIRELFTLRLAGHGYESIGRILRQRDPKRGWHRSSVYAALHLKTYRGTVVDESVWDRVNEIKGTLYGSRSTRRWEYPLAGALRCQCTHLLHGEATGRDRWRRRYYCCDRVALHGHRVIFQADDVEDQFQAMLESLKPDSLRSEYLPTRSNEPIEVRLRNLEADLRQNDVLRQRAWEREHDIAPGHLQARLDDLAERRQRIEAAIATARHESAAMAASEHIASTGADILTAMAARWRSMGLRRRQMAAQALSAFLGGLYVVDRDPSRLRGPKARKGSALGVLLPARDALSRGAVKVASSVAGVENMREINSLRDAQMAQRKADDGITKKFIQSISE